MLAFAIRIPSVQTRITHSLASYYSKQLKTEVRIGAVDIEFLKTVVLKDVFIQDLHKDTLLSLSAVKLNISGFDFDAHKLEVAAIELNDITAKCKFYKDEKDINFQFLINYFAPTDTTPTNDSIPWIIKANALKITNGHLVFKDENDTVKTSDVNYMDIDVSGFNLSLNSINQHHDSIFFNIEQLQLRDKSGIEIKHFAATNAGLSASHMAFDKLAIHLTNTKLDASDILFRFDSWGDFADYNNKVKMIGTIDSSTVYFTDLAGFAPQIKGMDAVIKLKGKGKGTVSALKCKDVEFYYGANTYYKGNATLNGLPNIDETLLEFDIKRLTATQKDIHAFTLPLDKGIKQYIPLPSELSVLGLMSFTGKYSGFYNDFVAYGVFNSALGNLTSDVSLKLNGKDNKAFYKGKLKSSGFNIGKLIGTSELGMIALNAKIDGSGFESNKVDAELNGTIQRFDAHGYSYTNMEIKAHMKKGVFDGDLQMNDKNVGMQFTGEVDFNEEIPKLNFDTRIRHANLTALNLLPGNDSISLSSDITINMNGNTIDNITGYIIGDNTHYYRNGKSYDFEHFNLTSRKNGNQKELTFSSDAMDVNVKGAYTFKELATSFNKMLSGVIPTYFQNKELNPKEVQQFNATIKFKDSDAFTSLFLSNTKIAPESNVALDFNSTKSEMDMHVNSKRFIIYGNDLYDLKADATIRGGMLTFEAISSSIAITDSVQLKNFDLKVETKNDTSAIAILWDNKTKVNYKADIKAEAIFGLHPQFDLKIFSSDLVIADTTWHIAALNRIIFDSSCTTISNLEFTHRDQKLNITGNTSGNKGDSLWIVFDNFNLVNFNRFLASSGSKLNGIINSKTAISDIYNSPVIISNATFQDLTINNEVIGNGFIESQWLGNKDALSVNGSFTKALLPSLTFTGFYYPKSKEDNLDFKVDLRHLSLGTIQPYVKDYCKDFIGYMHGNVTVKGKTNMPQINGVLHVEAQKITYDYLGTSYAFSHDITIEPYSFGIENMIVYDQIHQQISKTGASVPPSKSGKIQGTAIVNGKVYHDNFSNFQLDFDIQPYKMMVLNTNESQNNLYYGQAYITGPYVNIFGYINNILYIEANVKTDKVSIAKKSGITKFYLPLSGTSEVGENDFIQFVKKDSTQKKNEYKFNLSGVQLDFNLEVTPDAEAQIVFDQTLGDAIKSRGNGQLNLSINTLGKFNMYGNYTVESGDYLFTLQNIINKRFDLEEGGTIKWSGDPYDADVNLKASYKLRTSLTPLFDTTSKYKRRYPIDCGMILTNKLMKPDIGFDIDAPTVDEGTRRDIRNIVNNELEINRQVFSLMVLGSFITPQSAGGTNQSGNAGTTASSELLSNQLSNWLSNISKDFDLGVKYRAGDKVSNDELQVALSTQLFNNRLSIDGNVGVSSRTTQSTNNLVGDVNVEYKLTDDGKFRVKAFNKSNDNLILNNNNTPFTQGIGVFYRQEFNAFKDIFNSKKKKKQTNFLQ